ncbi:MAG: two-component system response regulator [Rubrivivax sp.]
MRPMTVLHRVCLIGFGTFERSTFDLFFRMAEQRARRDGSGHQGGPRDHGYLLVTPSQHPEIILINGDVPDAVGEAWRWPGRCVSIGGVPFAGAVAHLPRPVHMHTLFKVLDHLVPSGSRQHPVANGPSQDQLRKAREAAVRAEAVPSRPAFTDAGEGEGAARTPLLVVDDNENTLRSMGRFLRRQGLQAHFARSGEEALWRVSQGSYRLVLLDARMGGISGWVACRLIKTRPYPAGQAAPRVVMMARPEGLLDGLWVHLSRCDERLYKPLGKTQVLAQVKPLLADIPKGMAPLDGYSLSQRQD